MDDRESRSEDWAAAVARCERSLVAGSGGRLRGVTVAVVNVVGERYEVVKAAVDLATARPRPSSRRPRRRVSAV